MKESAPDERASIRAFVDATVLPIARDLDRQQRIPAELIAALAGRGYLGASIKKRYGGTELDPHATCVLHEEIARGHGSVENLLTVTAMASTAIQRLGSPALRERWLPLIAQGRILVGIALTEPGAGSNLDAITTELIEAGDGYRLRGCKRWITLGQAADLFVVLCKTVAGAAVVLVERETAGLRIEPIDDLLGLRANMLAELRFEDCRVAKSDLLGTSDRGLPAAIQFALDEGRFATACGSLGLAKASLRVALDHLRRREDLARHQLVQRALTEMIVEVQAAQAACMKAADSRSALDPGLILATLIAKYAASKAATSVSSKAVQVLGAAGCQANAHVERYYRDARIMEIIEGTTQVHETEIARLSLSAL